MSTVPTMTRTLSYAGLIPFIACTIGLFAVPDLTPRFALGLLTWGAMILSFFGGAWWRLAWTSTVPGGNRMLLMVATLPPLFGWIAQLFEMKEGIITVIIGLLMALAIDAGLTRRNAWTYDYLTMRIICTAVSVGCLIAAMVKLIALGIY